VRGSRRHSGDGRVRDRDKNLRGGVTPVDEDERPVQVLRIREKRLGTMVFGIPRGGAGLTLDHQVQSVLGTKRVLAISPVDRRSQ
jgi:hypothetical protein